MSYLRRSLAAFWVGAVVATPQDLATQYTTVFGGGGGTSFSRDCGAGKVLVGVRGRYGGAIDAIGVMCAPLLSNGTLGPTSATGTLAGGTGGTAFELKCANQYGTGTNPYQAVVSRLFVTYGPVVNAVSIECAMWTPATKKWSTSDKRVVGSNGMNPLGTRAEASCTSTSQPGAGIRGRAGLFVDAIGLMCDEP
jgi:hypothetical protein